jgi:hypothetical protein
MEHFLQIMITPCPASQLQGWKMMNGMIFSVKKKERKRLDLFFL